MTADGLSKNGRKALKLVENIDASVFPCRAEPEWIGDKLYGIKSPYTTHGFEDATRDEKKIRRWWTQHPDALVGVWTGDSGLNVADIDTKEGKDGWASILEHADGDKMQDDLAGTFGYPTSSGGDHAIFLREKGNELEPHVNLQLPDGSNLADVDRRSGDSYIVWWGKVPKSRDVFKPEPSWLALSYGSSSDKNPYDGTVGDWLATAHKGAPDLAMIQAMGRVPAKKEISHEQVRDIQANMVHLIAEGHPGGLEALEYLRGEYLRPPYDTRQWQEKWEALLAGAIHRHGAPKPEEMPYTFTQAELKERAKKEKKSKKDKAPSPAPPVDENPIKILRLSELLNRPAPEWWVPGLIQQSTVAILAGEPGIGKSFLMLDIACRIASGTDFFGRRVKRGKVLYVVAEGAANFGKRATAWQDYNKLQVPEDAIGFVESGVNLSNPVSMNHLEEALLREQSDLIILDTLSQLSALDNENDAAEMAGVLNAARRIREIRPGSTVVIVHHVNKSERGKVRGSGAIRANVDTVIVARQSSQGGTFSLSTELNEDGKQKDGVAEKLQGFMLVSYLDSAIVGRNEAAADEDGIAIDATLEDGEWHGIKDFQTTRGDNSNATSQRLKARLGKLTETGLVEANDANTSGKKWRAAPRF